MGAEPAWEEREAGAGPTVYPTGREIWHALPPQHPRVGHQTKSALSVPPTRWWLDGTEDQLKRLDKQIHYRIQCQIQIQLKGGLRRGLLNL